MRVLYAIHQPHSDGTACFVRVVDLHCLLLVSSRPPGCLVHVAPLRLFFILFFFNDTATTEIYTLSLHDALPIWPKTNPQKSWKSPERNLTEFTTSNF